MTLRPIVCGLLLLLGAAAPALAVPTGTMPSCKATPAVWGGFPSLPRVAGVLAGPAPLTVVALGSSSTFGVGASAPDRTYPAQLQQILAAELAGRTVSVVNRGIGGETVADNLARIDRDVLALRPDLVIWQVGTNDALRAVPAEQLRADLVEGITRLRAAGADVVLLDPQPVPDPAKEAAIERVRAVLLDVAHATKVVLLPRHELMMAWLASGEFTPKTLLGPDGLHMTDASYRCLALRIADLFAQPSRIGTVQRTAQTP